MTEEELARIERAFVESDDSYKYIPGLVAAVRRLLAEVERLRKMVPKVKNAQEIVAEVRRELPVDDELRRKLLTADTLLRMAGVDAEKASPPLT